jgi:hypothetical protein
MTQYFEGFDRLLLRLVPITPYHAVFSHRKLVITVNPIDATTKVQGLFDLHIRPRQMQLDPRDTAIDKGAVTFICLPDQLRRVYKFTPLMPLPNVVGVSPSVFESLGVPAGECAVYWRDGEETIHFQCTSRNAIKHMKPSYMIAESVSRRCIVKSKLPVLAFSSRAPRDTVLAFLKDIARGFPDFQMMSVNDAESQFMSSLIVAPVNRWFNNLMVFNASGHYYFNVSSWLQRLVDQEFNPEIWKQIFLNVLRQVQSENVPKVGTRSQEPENVEGSIQPLAESNHFGAVMDKAPDTTPRLPRDNLTAARPVLRRVKRLPPARPHAVGHGVSQRTRRARLKAEELSFGPGVGGTQAGPDAPSRVRQGPTAHIEDFSFATFFSVFCVHYLFPYPWYFDCFILC